MNGRKPKSTRAVNGNEPWKSDPIRWVNAPLTDEDHNNLERTAVSIELLAANLIQLVISGLGVSVKFDRARESYNVCIYRPGDTDNSGTIGLSGHAADLRDALLVTMYRLDVHLGGHLDDSSPVNTPSKLGRRFG